MAFIVKKQANLKFKKNTTFKIPRIPFLPSSLGGLSLWLKADAGVTVATSGPYTYVSQIVITGSNTPNVNGTYNATSVPTFDYGIPIEYVLVGPSYTITWIPSNNYFYLQTGGFNEYWTSSDGVNWEVGDSITDTITISGSTTPDVNGVYTRPVDENVFYGPTYAIENYGNFQLLDQATVTIYYTASSATGPWTIVDGSGAITSTSTLAPRGSITATKVVSSSAVTAWADQSGNGNDATATDTPTLSTVDGKTFVDFAGGYFTGNELITSPYVTIMCVARFSAQLDVSIMFEQFSDNVDNMAFYWGFNLDNGFRVYNGTDVNSSSLTNADETYIFGTTINNDTGTLYLNGDQDGSDYCGEQVPAGSYYLGRWVGGERTAASMRMAEIVIYNRVLTTPEREQVEEYLNTKYLIY